MNHLHLDERDRRRQVIAEVEWLIESGEWPARIARRLGYPTTDALRITLDRWGRRDLARYIDRQAA